MISSKSKPLEPPCLLIVDDDPSVRSSFRLTLEDRYRILEAGSVDEALEVLEVDRPDLVTMDLRMPHKSGFDGIRLIRARDREMPVILVSAFATLDTACDAMRLGASDCLQKPCSADQLKDTIERHLLHFSAASGNEDESLGTTRAVLAAPDKSNLAMVGKASQAFAHDLASQLLVLGLSTDLSQELLNSGPPWSEAQMLELREHLRRMELVVGWSAELTKQWRSLVDHDSWNRGNWSVQEIVDQAIQIARPQAEIYEVHLSLEPIPTLPKISGDKTQLVRALVNLLVNAINGSSSKGKEVVVSVRDRAGHLAIEVADNGIGIAEERLATLVKSDPFASEEGPSAGLGLFIANWVARNHHGELRLRRNEPTGTTASLLLPLMI